MSEQIRREFTIPFSIAKINAAIKDTCRTSPGGRQLNDHNAAFNTFSVTLVRNLYVLPTTITLNSISENETHFELSAIPGPHLTRMASFTSSMIEDFLKQIGEFASGRLIVKAAPPKLAAPEGGPRQSNSFKTFILLIVVLSMLCGLIYWMSR